MNENRNKLQKMLDLCIDKFGFSRTEHFLTIISESRFL